MTLKLIHNECSLAMSFMEEKSVNLVVTSPPYDNLREYGDKESIFTFDKFKEIANQICRVLTDEGVVVWVVSDATINGSETGTSFKQALYFKEIGFNLHDTMIWQKSSCAFQNANRYINVFEYMFVFSKCLLKKVNLICDRQNRYAGATIHGTERQKSGTVIQKNGVLKNKVVKEYGARFNIWPINEVKCNTTGHPAVFPLELAEDHIKTWSNEGDTIMDPFMGSGTTGLACINLNRKFIGIEKNLDYFDTATKRILEHEDKKTRDQGTRDFFRF